MRGVLAAERAILAHFKTIGGILLVLESIVVPLLAIVASQSDFNSHIGTSLYYLAYKPSCLPVRNGLSNLVNFRARKKTSPPTGNVYFSTILYAGQQFSSHFC